MNGSGQVSGVAASSVSDPAREAEEFLYIVTHDLKAFARAMRTIPDWIDEDLAAHGQTLPADAAENMQMLRDYAVRMDAAMDALTELSRVGRMVDPAAPHDLGALVTAECAALPRLPRLDCDIRCDGLHVLAPSMDLRRLFSAVLGNAAAHHDRAFGRLRIEATAQGDRVQVTVTDDGPGIPAPHRESVFKPLGTLRPKSETGHAGVGLAIARKVVGTLGGTIEVAETGAPRGCALRFDLPLARLTH